MNTRYGTRDAYMEAFKELVGQPMPADVFDTLNVLSFYKLDVVLALVNLAKNTNGHAETAEDTAVDTVARVLDVMTGYAGSKNAKVRELLAELKAAIEGDGETIAIIDDAEIDQAPPAVDWEGEEDAELSYVG